jgi:hypothetical protein
MTDGAGGNGAQPAQDQSTAELVRQASEQVTRLIRSELALAKAELAQRGRRVGAGAGLFGTGGLLLLYGLGVLVIAAVAGLATVLAVWLAALLVGVGLLALAGLLALVGRGQFRRAQSKPSVAQSVREDMTAVTTAVRERSRP